jgi:hypothetical protein
LRRVGVAVGLLVVVLVANPRWARALGLDVWSLPELHEQLAAGAAKSRDFEREGEVVLRRIQLKDRMVDDLIDGRSTLAEIARRFHNLDRYRPGYMTVIRATVPGRTDRERSARNVLSFVAPRVADLTVSHREEVLTRLETEFSSLVSEESSDTE